ncbi:MAG: DUF4838 domain-containing protein [Candidatus Hydrogenedentes bacterium]|nr:DUF4838 domain-containing protein [Candidatus Hydrogenedentota bacterium]
MLSRILIVALVAMVSMAWGVDVVRDGKPTAVICVGADAGGQARAAAELCVAYVQESTGATLPIVSAVPDEGTVLFIGPNPFELDLTGLDDDGYVIAFPDARSIAIQGPTGWGTEFGVYEFLERYVGIRWLMPGKDGTDVPVQEDLLVPAESVRSEPAFFSRLFSGLQGAAQTDWARRNRMHGRISFHHNLLHLFPPETYTKTHPEFFPVHDRERFLPTTNSAHHWQPCFTAPGIVEAAIENINAYFDANPDTPSYSLGTNDSSGYCTCENCLARISGGKNFLMRTDYSDLYYDWANQVIEGVLQKHPDKWFGCLAYSEVAAPPGKVKVHPRLIPYLTYDRMKWKNAGLRETGEALTADWHAKSPVLGWYDYIYGTPYCLPRVWFHHMAEYYRFGHANGVRALYAEAYPNWGEGPKLYVSLKLQWDPSLDVDALLQEWYARCVGEEAAPHLAAYYAHWEDFWTRRVLDSAWFTESGQYLNFYDPAYLNDVGLDEIRKSRSLLDRVLVKADTEKQKARATLLLRAFEYYESTAYAYKLANPMNEAIETPEQAIAVLDSARDSAVHIAKRKRLALVEFPNDPVLRHPIPITNSARLQADTWAGGGLWRVYDVAAANAPGVRERLGEIASGEGPTMLAAQARLMLTLLDGGMKPINTNGSFESGKGNLADGWSLWVKWGIGTMRRSDQVAHNGQFSILSESMKRGGPCATLPATPGTYGLVCFVYTPEGQVSKGTAELSLTLRDGAGNNLPSQSAKIVPAPGRWTALGVAAEVPESIGGTPVATLMPILIVNGFETGEQIYIDDLALYRMDE